MRKILVILLLIAGCYQVMADDNYTYLVFQKGDGTKQSVTAMGATITFNGDEATVVNGSESATFTLSELSSMFFSTTAETTAISELAATNDAEVEVYSASGVYVGSFSNIETLKDKLQGGVYIVKQNGETTKIAVR